MEVGRLSQYSQGFIHLNCCRISSINSMFALLDSLECIKRTWGQSPKVELNLNKPILLGMLSMINSETRTIHGTGIFTYMNGWFIWEMLVDMPYMDCMRNDSFGTMLFFFFAPRIGRFLRPFCWGWWKKNGEIWRWTVSVAKFFSENCRLFLKPFSENYTSEH